MERILYFVLFIETVMAIVLGILLVTIDNISKLSGMILIGVGSMLFAISLLVMLCRSGKSKIKSINLNTNSSAGMDNRIGIGVDTIELRSVGSSLSNNSDTIRSLASIVANIHGMSADSMTSNQRSETTSQRSETTSQRNETISQRNETISAILSHGESVDSITSDA
jgi:hypothetical protein